MNVLVTGPSSFLNQAITAGLLAAGHHVRCGRSMPAALPSGCTVVLTGGLVGLPVGDLQAIRHVIAVAAPSILPGPAASADETAVAATGWGWSFLRSTVLHQSLDRWLHRAARRTVTIAPPGIRHQPVDAAALVRRVAAVVSAGPTGCVPVLAGPEIHSLASLAARWSAARGRQVQLVQARSSEIPATFHAECAVPERALGGLTWQGYLARTAAPDLSEAAALRLH